MKNKLEDITCDIRPQKRVSLEITQEQPKLFERLEIKPSWIWNIDEHKQEDIRANRSCCFNHIIGLPQKDANDKALYDYERIIFDNIIERYKVLLSPSLWTMIILN